VAKEGFFTAVKGFYTFTTRSLRARFGISGKPGVSGPNPRDSAPPESSEQIFKEFDFYIDLEDCLCDICEPEQYQHFGLATNKQGNNSPNVVL
jgi:hypothetical protein